MTTLLIIDTVVNAFWLKPEGCAMRFYSSKWLRLMLLACICCIIWCWIYSLGIIPHNSESSRHTFPNPGRSPFWSERLLSCCSAAISSSSFVAFSSVHTVPDLTNTSTGLTEYKMTEQTADLNLSPDEYIFVSEKKKEKPQYFALVLLSISLWLKY